VNKNFLFLVEVVLLVVVFHEFRCQLYNEVELAENGIDTEVVHDVGSTEIGPPQKVDVLNVSVHRLLVLLVRYFQLS